MGEVSMGGRAIVRRFKRWVIISLGISMLAVSSSVLSCGPIKQTPETTTTEGPPFSNADYYNLDENPDDYIGRQGTVYGQISNIVEYTDGSADVIILPDIGLVPRAFLLKAKSKGNLIKGDFVKATGEFAGLEQVGILGEEPAIEVTKIEKVDPFIAIPIMTPPIKVVTVKQTKNQQGFIVTLEKIDFTEDHTRAYIRVKNESPDEVSLFASSASAVQGSRQFETEPTIADLPTLPSDILPSIEAQEVVVFERLDIESKQARFVFEGSSENFDIDIEPFAFEVTW